MKRFRLLGMLLIAVFVAAMALSAVAAAKETPLNLPFTANDTFTGKSEGEPKLISLQLHRSGVIQSRRRKALLRLKTDRIEQNALVPLHRERTNRKTRGARKTWRAKN